MRLSPQSLGFARGDVMTARLRSWWRQLRQQRVAIALTTVIIVITIVLIIIGYRFDWTGFNVYSIIWLPKATNGTSLPITRFEEQQPAKTLWDWLQLLIAPGVISLAVAWFTHTQQQRDRRLEQLQHDRDQQLADQRAKSEREATEQRAQIEREIALDNQREVALQAYIDKMSELMLNENMRNPTESVRMIARVRTMTILPRLDNHRKGSVLQFLHESGLIEKGKSIINLNGAHFGGALLWNADLWNADLGSAILSEARLTEANLSQSNLKGAHLLRTILRGANLSGADLSGAYLEGADLREANLSGADLSAADLNGANLCKAKITEEQLDKVYSLEGATMPDGSKHP